MRILLTNDDGVYAPGLAAMETELRRIADVTVVSPMTEQSGVGHAITFLTPLIAREVFDGERLRGFGVEGSPADCVKLGISALLSERPDMVVSGINSGLNAGINVLYSGTVAAAIEGAFFGITSIAVSLEFDELANYERAAALARQVIEQLQEHETPGPHLYNFNMPTVAMEQASPELILVPMGVARYGESFEKRTDPRGRSYYWATNEPPPPPSEHETDVTALAKGLMTLTPLDFAMTNQRRLEEMQSWRFQL